MMRAIVLCLVLAAGLLVGCQGHHGEASGSGAPGSGPQRGELLSMPARVGSYSIADLLASLGGNDPGKELLTLAYSPICSVDVYELRYETVGGRGEAATSSGALMIPTGADSSCQGPRPIVLYAHGTMTDQTFDIAALSNSNDVEGLLLAAVFVTRGYIVVAPNYAGYASSSLGYHPYLNADQQSKEMIDVLTAARSSLPVPSAPFVSDDHRLFITGYSQGGFVAMAAHRAMQAAGITVTAAAPMSGPYALAASADALFMGEVGPGSPAHLTMLVSSYQHAYGNLYTNTTDMFAAPYASDVGSLLPSRTPLGELYSENKLPRSALFSSVPPAPEFAALTPATTPAALAPIFAMGFGASPLVTNDYRLAYLRDEQAAPDGGFPVVSTGVPAPSPTNTFRQDLKNNDLRTWTPTAPVLLCAGDQDPTVFYLNTRLMQSYWTAHAAGPTVTVLDVDASVSSGDSYAAEKTAFAAAKALVAASAVAGGATDGGAGAVLQAYHALVSPVCLSAVRSFFDGF